MEAARSAPPQCCSGGRTLICHSRLFLVVKNIAGTTIRRLRPAQVSNIMSRTEPTGNDASDAQDKDRRKSGALSYRSGGKDRFVVPEARGFVAGFSAGASLADLKKAIGKRGRVEFSAAHEVAVVTCPPGGDPAEIQRSLKQLTREGTLKFWAPLLRDQETGSLQIPNDEITVRFNPKVKPAAVQKLAAAHGMTIARQNEFVKHQFVLKMEKPQGAAMLDAASDLDRETAVEFAAPNFLSEFRKLS